MCQVRIKICCGVFQQLSVVHWARKKRTASPIGPQTAVGGPYSSERGPPSQRRLSLLIGCWYFQNLWSTVWMLLINAIKWKYWHNPRLSCEEKMGPLHWGPFETTSWPLGMSKDFSGLEPILHCKNIAKGTTDPRHWVLWPLVQSRSFNKLWNLG